MKSTLTHGQVDSETFFVEHRTEMTKAEYISWISQMTGLIESPKLIGNDINLLLKRDDDGR